MWYLVIFHDKNIEDDKNLGFQDFCLTHLVPYAVLLRKSGVLGAQPLAWPMWGNAPFMKMKMIEETCGFLTRPNLASEDL